MRASRRWAPAALATFIGYGGGFMALAVAVALGMGPEAGAVQTPVVTRGWSFPPVWIVIFPAGAILPLALLVLFPRPLPFQPVIIALIATAGMATTLSAGIFLAQSAAAAAGESAGWAAIAAVFAAVLAASVLLVRLLPVGRPSRTSGIVQASAACGALMLLLAV